LARQILEWKGKKSHAIYKLNLPKRSAVELDYDQILDREELPDFIDYGDWESVVGSYYRVPGGISKKYIIGQVG